MDSKVTFEVANSNIWLNHLATTTIIQEVNSWASNCNQTHTGIALQSIATPPCQVHLLSAYEFAMHYHMQQAKHPITKASHEKHQHDADLYHAALTDSGIAKVTNGIKQLNPNADYQIREDGDAGWIPLGRGEHAQPYRHDWIVVPRKAAVCAGALWCSRKPHRR